MTTTTDESPHGPLDLDRVAAAIEAHGDGAAMVLLWLVPALAVVVALVRL